ncbi:pilus assembly protein [Cereibacter sphaeroides]|uniref:TadE/TadG family type IV pilus assembly protein n=1 Tax=Cereibacter sphaeroides TaxID=1063 RepID=UPI001F44DCD1|nr:TadE family protein [Cereibacter sphaeroides]MCE6951402.1 pilus assembly protein [Cereibacter sphaeroides]
MRASRPSFLRRFHADDRGAALVEFTLALPMMLVVFAVIVEGARMLVAYQAAISGVRDAVRYVARVAPADMCELTGTQPPDYSDRLRSIVGSSQTGGGVLPGAVTLGTVAVSYDCTGADTFRGGIPAVATVSAQLTIDFPFSGIFTLVGGDAPSVTTTVADSARIYGT